MNTVQNLKHGFNVNLNTRHLNILPSISIGFVENIVINKDNAVGLDQYAYAATKAGEYNEFYAADGTYENGKWTVPGRTKPREIAYWRKHPNLQGWMQRLWESRGNSGRFNGDELELTWEDLDNLERAVTHKQLPATGGFFFGDNSYEYYQGHDLEFIKNARAELFVGLKVFYNSSW